MEWRIQALATILDLNTDLLLNCAEGITEEMAHQRLAGGGNNIAFLVAHLADARYFLATLLETPLPNPLSATLASANSIEDVQEWPPFPELLRSWREVSAHLAVVLGQMTPEKLDAPSPHSFPIPGGTAFHAVAFLVQHDSYHVGQVAFLRRQVGLPAMSYTRSHEDGAVRPGLRPAGSDTTGSSRC
jgi:uncharacterized damage-inducible protein DinB